MTKPLRASIVVGLSGWTLAHAANQPPAESFVVTPAKAAIGRNLSVDASARTDDHAAVSKLKVRWDWERERSTGEPTFSSSSLYSAPLQFSIDTGGHCRYS